MKAYHVCRLLTFQTGESIMLPLKLYDDEVAANRFKQEVDDATRGMLPFAIVAMGPGGRAQSTGMNLAAALQGLGIKDISVHVFTVEVEGSIAVPERPRIILAGN